MSATSKLSPLCSLILIALAATLSGCAGPAAGETAAYPVELRESLFLSRIRPTVPNPRILPVVSTEVAVARRGGGEWTRRPPILAARAR
jgi:hypothetical protein